MFKDHRDINHRNKADYTKSLKALADALEKRKEDEDAFAQFLLEGQKFDPCDHSGADHSVCTHLNNNTSTVTEKRICRCMRFYGEAECSMAAECLFPVKRRNDTSKLFKIVDYEQPTPYKAAKLGGIDLVWEWKGKKYAVEVKPPNSDETLIRMVAEILTYTWHDPRYQPAICFFKYKCKLSKDAKTYEVTQELSEQAKEFRRYRDNDDFKTMMKHVHLFWFSMDDDCFYIHDGETESVCE